MSLVSYARQREGRVEPRILLGVGWGWGGMWGGRGKIGGVGVELACQVPVTVGDSGLRVCVPRYTCDVSRSLSTPFVGSFTHDVIIPQQDKRVRYNEVVSFLTKQEE